MRIGVTGHINLTENTARLIADALAEHLAGIAPTGLVGLSCLAPGADALFARAILERGGALEVVLPSPAYRRTRVGPDYAAEFDRLLARAAEVRVMPYEVADREAYEAANNALLDACDRLVAVWDGLPSEDRGGTAAVVADAGARGLAVTVLWPRGAERAA